METYKSNKKTTKRGKLRTRRQYRPRFNILNSTPYSLRQSTQTLGPGKFLARVTNNFQVVNADKTIAHYNQNIMYEVFNNVEFERNLSLYRYFKVIGHKIIIPPRLNTDNSQLPNARISVDWADGTGENIIQDDGSKEISAYSTKTHIFRFRSPNVLIKAPTGSYYFNYSEWLPTNQTSGFVPPGYIKVSSAFTFNYTVETLVIFKGSQTNNAANNKIIKMKLIDKENKENEIKEEEEKEISKIEEQEKEQEEDNGDGEIDNIINKLNRLKLK